MATAMITRNTGEPHPYDYYYRPGMALRPPPPRIVTSPDWFFLRKRLFSQYMEVLETPKPTPLTRLLDDHYWQGDELGDNVAAMARRIGMQNFRPMLDRALDEGIDKVKDPPAELVALFEQVDRFPDWFDPEAFERGRLAWVNGTAFGKMGGGVLNQVFTTEGEAVSNSTGSTGRFKRDLIRRMLESIEFMACLSRPDALDRFSHTFKTIVRVRLMHCMARHGLRQLWGPESFAHNGDPISSTDMVLGSPSFGLANLLIDASFGWKITVAELDDINMWWNLHVYRFGVDEHIIPRTGIESIALFDHVLSTYGKASKWSTELQNCFADYNRQAMLSSDSKLVNWLMEKVMRLYVGMGIEICGEELGFRTMAGFRYSEEQMRRQAAVLRGLARATVPIMSLMDRRAGRLERWRKNAANGDSALNQQEKLNEKIAAKKGTQSSGFTHHDNNRPGDLEKR